MIKRLFVAALVAASAAVAAPAFASGYGPAPYYNPLAGAPVSQRGQSVQTFRAEQAELMARADVAAQSYGGTRDMTSESGARVVRVVRDTEPSPFAHH
ncbi:hypothetical protein [Paraburkholderia flava]|uniref:hypothetical protein n=1 Tax=Paraburkholderia flava TaxID=2547393 RepID=UPI0010602759|nr:hypothetical protein [Paraburkholderia flava]